MVPEIPFSALTDDLVALFLEVFITADFTVHQYVVASLLFQAPDHLVIFVVFGTVEYKQVAVPACIPLLYPIEIQYAACKKHRFACYLPDLGGNVSGEAR